MRRAASNDLLFVSKAPKEKVDAFAAGASLVDRTGYTIVELRIKATLDRFAFASTMLASAEAAIHSRSPMNRVAVSRGYYSMYHALRATSFFVFGGDDHEKHADLPSRLPGDFPQRLTWENSLKSARLERNRADYDPYPKNDLSFAPAAVQIIADARSLMPVVKAYLKRKGCFA